MKGLKILLPILLSALSLTACGDTSAVDSIISKNETTATQAPSAAIDSTDDPNAIAESYWADKETTPVPEQVDLKDVVKSNGDIDIDLTILDSNIVYAQVYDMLTNPEDYIGKTVKADGTFAYTTDPSTGGEYFAVFIADASACCAQGIEFDRGEEFTYPDDYPEIDAPITVVGTFNIYEENGYTYAQLKDAVMTA